MNKNTNEKTRNAAKAGFKESAIYLLVVTLCTAIVFVTKSPVLYFPMLAVASAFFGTAMHRGGQSLGLIYAVFVAVIIYLLTNSVWQTALFISVFLPAGTAFFICISSKRPLNSFVAEGFIATTVMVLASGIIYVFENSNPFSFDVALAPVFAGMKNVLGETFDTLAANGISILNMSRTEYVSTMFSQLLVGLPVFYAVLCLCSVLLGFVITRNLYASKYGKDPETLKYFGKVRDLRVSIPGGIFFILANLAYLLSDESGEFAFGLSIFVAVMNYIFAVEGIAVLMSFMSLKEVKKPIRVITCIVSVLLCTTIVSNLFSLVGLFDCFYNIRVRMSGKGGRKL